MSNTSSTFQNNRTISRNRNSTCLKSATFHALSTTANRWRANLHTFHCLRPEKSTQIHLLLPNLRESAGSFPWSVNSNWCATVANEAQLLFIRGVPLFSVAFYHFLPCRDHTKRTLTTEGNRYRALRLPLELKLRKKYVNFTRNAGDDGFLVHDFFTKMATFNDVR